MAMTFETPVVFNKSFHQLYTGTGTAGQAGSSSAAYIPSLWTFNTSLTPSAGDMIVVEVPIAGVNAGVWISIDNGTTYLPVAVIAKTRLTTHFGVGAKVLLIYETNVITAMYGTDTTGAAAGASTTEVTGNRWTILNYYDSNTTYSPASLGFGYGTCATAADTAAKTATLSSYKLTTGGIVAIKFSYAVGANATLSINSTTAKAIYYDGEKIKAGVISAGDIAVFVYSSYFRLIAIHKAATGRVVMMQSATATSSGVTRYVPYVSAYSGEAELFGSTRLYLWENTSGAWFNIGNGTKGGISLWDTKSGSTQYYGNIQMGTLTANRTFTFPNNTGTIALTSDIPSVPSWALASSKPTYTATEVGALPSTTTYVSTVNGSSGAVTVRELPAVTASDNGKFLRVVEGAWAAATVASANGVSF